MELLSKAFGVYETNCYILKSKVGDFIIDAGIDSASWVCENAKNPLAILNTHGHFDHIWCNAELREQLQIPIYCPKGDCFMLKSDCFNLGLTPCAPDFEAMPNEIFTFKSDFLAQWREKNATARHSERSATARSEESKKFVDSSVASLPQNDENYIIVEFMHFAGHTPGCSVIKIKEAQSADSSAYFFSGDFIFYRTIGRTDFPYSSPKDMAESLKRFGKLDFDAKLYPGHGQSTTIKAEQAHLPLYLRGLVC